MDNLKVLLHLHVARLVERQTREMGTAATPLFVAALVEIAYAQASVLGHDLEAFAHHAGRLVVAEEDVMLAVRKNPLLVLALRNARVAS